MARLKKSIAQMESTGWMYVIKAWTDDAWQDFEYWTKQDKKTLNRILKLLRDID